VRQLAERKLEEVEEQLGQLTNLRDDLRSLLKDWDELLTGRTRTERAGLLEALVTSDYAKEHRQSPIARSSISRKKKKESNE
jgi:predicted translin family RNA/ssDNA-binding protein